MKTIRIFISSPGDVADEREKAVLVINQLQKRYADRAILKPVLWEQLPLQPDASFQESIDTVMSDKGVDIAIFILWSRLGSEVVGMTKPDGSPYKSGTEREFDVMLASREASPQDNKHPDILVYTREDEDTFADKLHHHKSSHELHELVQQKILAEQFITENFRDEKGRNIRAFHTFPAPIDFASRLKVHLTTLLDERLTPSVSGSWLGNPYRGLSSFQFEHSLIFFGREKETDDLAALLRARERDPSDGCAFACVVGGSGSGKSSLIRAGLAPELVSCTFAEHSDNLKWIFIPLKPSELVPDLATRFIKALALQFPELTKNTPTEDLAEALIDNPDTFLKLSLIPSIQFASAEEGSKIKVLLLIDQFEECFTLPEFKDSDIISKVLLPILKTLANSGCFWVVTTIRSDYYSSVQNLSGFLDLRGSSNFDLIPPEKNSIQRIVSHPAAIAGASFETIEASSGLTLADVILKDVDQQPDALPLLQFTLEELFERGQSKHLLTLADYQDMGGINGAIQTRAEQTIQELAEHSVHGKDIEIAFPHLFSKLFNLNTNSKKETTVRRLATEKELLEDSPHSETTKALLSSFTEARLLIASEKTGLRSYSVTHEALLHSWPRLVDLREKEHENFRRRERIEIAQKTYENNPDKSLLLSSGLPLSEATELLAKSSYLLTRPMVRYIQTSIDHNQRRLRKKHLIRTVTISLLSVLTILAVVSAINSRKKTIEVRKAKAITQDTLDVVQLQSDERIEYLQQASKIEISYALSIYSTDSEADIESLPHLERALRYNIHNHATARQAATLLFDPNSNVSRLLHCWENSDTVTCTQFSPDGEYIASGSADGNLCLYNTRSGATQWTVKLGKRIRTLSISHDGKKIAIGSDGGTTRIFDLATGSLLHELTRFEDSVETLAFSPNDLTIAVGSYDDTLKVFDTASGTPLWTYKFGDDVKHLEFSPDGSYVAAGSNDHKVQLLDAKTGVVVQTHVAKGPVNHVSFSPNGKFIATVSPNGFFDMVYTSTEKLSYRHPPSLGAWVVKYSPDGTSIALGMRDKKLRVIDPVSKTELWNYEMDGAVVGVDYTPDGKNMAVRAHGKMLSLLDAYTGEELWTINFDGPVRCSDISSDGTYVAAGSVDKTLRLFKVYKDKKLSASQLSNVKDFSYQKNGEKITIITKDNKLLYTDTTGKTTPHPNLKTELRDLQFIDDGSTVSYLTDNHNFEILNHTNTSTPRQIPRLKSTASRVAFSTDGSSMAMANKTHISLYSTKSGEKLWQSSTPKPIRNIYFSDNHDVIAVSMTGHAASILDATTGKELHKLPVSDSVRKMEFLNSAPHLLIGTNDRTLRLYRLNPEAKYTAQELWNVILTREVSTFALSPDESLIAIQSDKSFTALIDAKTGRLIQKIPFEYGVKKLEFSQDNNTLVILSSAGRLHFLSLENLGSDCQIIADLLTYQSYVGMGRDSKNILISPRNLRETRKLISNKLMSPALTSTQRALHWKYAPPAKKTTRPNSDKSLRDFLNPHFRFRSSVTDSHIHTIYSMAPWHPLAPIALAQLKTNKGNSTRNKILCELTLQRLRESDTTLWGKSSIVDNAAYAAQQMKDQGFLELARETAKYAISLQPNHKKAADLLKSL